MMSIAALDGSRIVIMAVEDPEPNQIWGGFRDYSFDETKRIAVSLRQCDAVELHGLIGRDSRQHRDRRLPSKRFVDCRIQRRGES